MSSNPDPEFAAATSPLAALARDGHRDDHALKDLLAQAHIHLTRYFKAWLPAPPADELVELLTREALLRIALEARTPEPRADGDVLARWLAVAAEVAVEVLASGDPVTRDPPLRNPDGAAARETGTHPGRPGPSAP